MIKTPVWIRLTRHNPVEKKLNGVSRHGIFKESSLLDPGC